MATPKYSFDRIGKKWTTDEERQLVTMYTVNKLEVADISEVLKRMPGGVVERILKLRLADSRDDVRGHANVKASDYGMACLKWKSEKRSEKKLDKASPSDISSLHEKMDAISELLQDLLKRVKSIEKAMV